MTQIISFINLKGGVGKTTSAVNLAAAFANAKKRVLLIDLDMQANASQGLGVADPEYTIGGALLQKHELMTYPVADNLELVPCDMSFSSVEKELDGEAFEDLRMVVGEEYLLKDLISKTKGYDLVVLDCPPSLNYVTVNALAASTHVFVPIEAQVYSLEGVKRVIRSINSIKKRINPGISLGGLFFTQYDKRTILTKDLSEVVRDIAQGSLLNTAIGLNVALKEAPSFGQDIFAYDPESKGAMDYTELYKEINDIVFGSAATKKGSKEVDLGSIGAKFANYLDNQ